MTWQGTESQLLGEVMQEHHQYLSSKDCPVRQSTVTPRRWRETSCASPSISLVHLHLHSFTVHMYPLQPHSVLLLLACVSAAAAGTKTASAPRLTRSLDQVKPVVFYHGMGDSAHSKGMEELFDSLRAVSPEIFIHSVSVRAMFFCSSPIPCTVNRSERKMVLTTPSYR